MTRNPRENLLVPDAEADLYLIGLGIGGFDSRSVEVDSVLAQCDTILHLTAFDDDLRGHYSANVENLLPLYSSSDNAEEVYTEMMEHVYRVAVDSLGRGATSFLSYGHPLFLVDTNWMLLAKSVSSGLRVKSIAATSFLDQALCDLGRRFDFGVQYYESKFFMDHEVVIDSRMPLLLSQIGDFGDVTLRQTKQKYRRLEPLFGVIRNSYPSERKCYVVFSPWRRDMGPQIREAQIGSIETLISSIHVGCSFYVEGLYD